MIKTSTPPSAVSPSPSNSTTTSSTSPSRDNQSSSSYIKKHKTSLDFICSPTTIDSLSRPTLNHPLKKEEGNQSPNETSSPSYLSPKPSSPPPPSSYFNLSNASTSTTNNNMNDNNTYKKKSLECLPRELLALIGYHIMVDDSHTDEDGSTIIGGKHPSNLLPLLFTSKTIYESICFDNNPQLYNSLFRLTFDVKALDRRYQWMKKNLNKTSPPPSKGSGKKVFDLFSDPRSWAIDYRTRWEQTYRMCQVAKRCRIELPGICDKEAFVADLWNVWFLLTENDGKNIKFLNEHCQLRGFVLAFYKENLLKESLVPGYPRDSGDKALTVWICLLSGHDDIGEDIPSEVDEKIFMLRPYVFACAKYDIHYAPWHYRQLPFCAPDCTDHETDASIRLKAMTYKRFGYTWKRAPPHFVLGIYLVFLRLLERQPDRIGVKAGSSTFSTSQFEVGLPGLFSSSNSKKLIQSIDHDREWQRNTMCQDPHTSPGLPSLSFFGQIKGFWRGKFLFYDFDLYRQILAGNMRGVYTGTFAEQAAEFELNETIIKLPKDKVGGDGPLLSAGFKDEYDENGEEQDKIKNGYGFQLSNENEIVQEGWTKEILISGRVRTSWGWAKVRGRVRSWDGLVIIEMTYSRHVMGRWIWRGYLHTGGYMVGRWRDTFTAENLRGYEGAFGIIRAGDPLYPDHFPKRMEDSLGVNANVHPVNQNAHQQPQTNYNQAQQANHQPQQQLQTATFNNYPHTTRQNDNPSSSRTSSDSRNSALPQGRSGILNGNGS
ncbi:uncharacterized protein L201_002672 [Kwoniella dendrophila CBS 6074]|uniref:Uncharacterized protein n=1 Tax=Kwoniella dendrophila CBS 6074 TaxID=1295534 RepID=A0AAX4JT55_9TREE